MVGSLCWTSQRSLWSYASFSRHVEGQSTSVLESNSNLLHFHWQCNRASALSPTESQSPTDIDGVKNVHFEYIYHFRLTLNDRGPMPIFAGSSFPRPKVDCLLISTASIISTSNIPTIFGWHLMTRVLCLFSLDRRFSDRKSITYSYRRRQEYPWLQMYLPF